MIGTDYPKIQFSAFGLDLVEPMALITDTIMGALSLFLAYKVSKINSKLLFYKYWRFFFIWFGFGALLGGIGHTFFNQLGVIGKIPSWLSGPIAVFYAEKAMLSLHWKPSVKKILALFSKIKLVAVFMAFSFVLLTLTPEDNPTKPFLPVAINTIIGMLTFVGVLGFKYTEKIAKAFKFFWLGVLIMLPTAFIFLMKINFHQWFDKNDASHVLFCIGITYFFLGINSLSKGLIVPPKTAL